MSVDDVSDDCLTRIKDVLNRNKVKLWLSPFYSDEGGSNEDEIRNLASSYSTELSISFESSMGCLRALQSKALENLRERNKFQATGIATLKVRIPPESGKAKLLSFSIELSKTVKALIESIAEQINVPQQRLKVIFQGKILKDEETLLSQRVTHGSQIMAIVMADKSNAEKQEDLMKYLNSTKADVKLLAENESDEDYLQVADQTGKLLHIPNNEKKALILAMTLHEKGRVAMKDENYSLALLILLEAEKEFSYCNSNLLKTVDNYGILNLDIVWCYLNLESITQLPDAEERLRQCELSFHHSYGTNLERLIVLKGSAGNENALFLRLHLLQSIVLYHQNKFDEARELLERTEEELKSLQVDDDKMSQLMELGYSATEARLALRESGGNINAAVNVIETKRRNRKENEEAIEKERKLNRERKKLGKCMNGEWVDPQFHKALMAMGYSYRAAQWALAESCNNICNSISLIQEHPEYLPDDETKITDELIEQVCNVGFDRDQAKLALKKHKGNIDKAVEELVLNQGNVLNFSDSDSDSDDSGPSTSKRKHDEAYSRISEGMSRYEEDHLDLNLVAETALLNKYKDFLSKR